MTLPVSRDDISAAHARVAGFVRRTPTWTLPRAFGHDGPVSLKLELLQHGSSFKPRGAFNTMLVGPIPPVGVAAASGGNHGVAVAYAARELGVRARIFVPEIASPTKIAAIRGFGAVFVIGGARYADAQEACDLHIAASGALRVHPFDALTTIAGQGGVALEWEADGGPLDTVLVASGGGGLVAGVGAWLHGRVKVVAVEPEGSRALHAALAAGGPVDVAVDSVAADSLGARNVGALVYSICSQVIHHVALVRDDAIVDAQRTLWRDYRLAAEPGGAAPPSPPSCRARTGRVLVSGSACSCAGGTWIRRSWRRSRADLQEAEETKSRRPSIHSLVRFRARVRGDAEVLRRGPRAIDCYRNAVESRATLSRVGPRA